MEINFAVPMDIFLESQKVLNDNNDVLTWKFASYTIWSGIICETFEQVVEKIIKLYPNLTDDFMILTSNISNSQLIDFLQQSLYGRVDHYQQIPITKTTKVSIVGKDFKRYKLNENVFYSGNL